MNKTFYNRSLEKNGAQDGAVPHSRIAGDDMNISTREELDKFLADSMFQLSVEEREKALNDLHGIRNGGNENVENPATMNRLLEELDRNLNCKKKGTIYEQAERNNPAYISSREFRIMCLRASDYDPEASVKRILTFLEIQKALFSEEKLGKKILLDDLDEDAIESLKSGAMQISASTDKAGRKILFIFPRALKMKSFDSENRAKYYVLMALMESEEVQKMGFVAVYYSIGNSETTNHNRFYSGRLLDLPVRLAGFHACDGDWRTYYIGSVAIRRIPPSAVPKFRIHCGSDMECLYKLASFGIPRDSLPLSADRFQLDNRHHWAWYQQRQQLERNQPSTVLSSSVHQAVVPGPNDVLFGRVRNNGGNRALRKMVSALLEEYNASPKKYKTRMAEEVMKEIGNIGGRFLKLNSAGEWEEVSHVEALEKTAKTFRNFRRYTLEREES